MNAIPRTTNAERAGRWLGCAWRRFERQEARVICWLASKGLPARMARLLLWIAKLVTIGVLIYTSFWLVLLFLFGVTAAWVARNFDFDNESKLEWREGHSGVGLYDKNEWRHDMGDPDEP